MNTPNDNDKCDTESRIIAAARSLFLEKGYAETSMSDIAARAGINRPGLHYYFRTKDRMFHAVVGEIVSSIVPRVYSLLTQQDIPIADRLSGIIDAYYDLFAQNPRLPMFLIREMNRDAQMLLDTIIDLHLDEKFQHVKTSLCQEMAAGQLLNIPIRFIFCSFYGLLVTPLLTQDILRLVALNEGETLQQMLAQWKPYILSQVLHLLQPPQK